VGDQEEEDKEGLEGEWQEGEHWIEEWLWWWEEEEEE